MIVNQVSYREGYKYQLYKTGIYPTPFKDAALKLDFGAMNTDGVVTLLAGYAWDGSSGPTIDGKSDARASLLHDFFYQAIREGKLSPQMRSKVDDFYYQCCIEDGMNKVRAWIRRQGLRTRFAKAAAMPKNDRPVIVAP